MVARIRARSVVAAAYEKDVTLSIAQRLKRKIDAMPGMRAVLTRDGDYFVPLHQRVGAPPVRADLFVSIHADAFVRPEANGSSVYALRARRLELGRALAGTKENDADLVGGVNPPARTATSPAPCSTCRRPPRSTTASSSGAPCSAKLGTINRLHKPRWNRPASRCCAHPTSLGAGRNRLHQQPAGEERRLNDEAYQDKMAMALMRGVKRYFEEHARAKPAVAGFDEGERTTRIPSKSAARPG